MAGGAFSSYKGNSSNNLVKIQTNASFDSGFAIEFRAGTSGNNDNVRSIAVQADGKILVGGVIDYNYISAKTFFRLNSDGTLDSSFINSMAVNSPRPGEIGRAHV